MSRHLLVIGAQRCGTTYLHALLDDHPEITMARPARPEPKVFLSDQSAALGLEHYRRTYFAHAAGEEVLGEKSTSYLEDPLAALRAARVLGDPAIVVCLRDPVSRAVSQWRFSTANGLERRPLEPALLADLDGDQEWDRARTSVSPFAYVRRGRYADYLTSWLEAFPKDVHVCFLEELTTDPAAVAALYRAVGVEPTHRPTLADARVNASSGPVPELSDRVVALLRRYYADSDEALSVRLGRALPWRLAS